MSKDNLSPLTAYLDSEPAAHKAQSDFQQELENHGDNALDDEHHHTDTMLVHDTFLPPPTGDF